MLHQDGDSEVNAHASNQKIRWAEADARVEEEEEQMHLAVSVNTRRRADVPGSCQEDKKKSRYTWQTP